MLAHIVHHLLYRKKLGRLDQMLQRSGGKHTATLSLMYRNEAPDAFDRTSA